MSLPLGAPIARIEPPDTLLVPRFNATFVPEICDPLALLFSGVSFPRISAPN